jgi:3-oxoacyl-[acyl-carrier protein] reductase
MSEFTGKAVLVTGAGRGIGKRLAMGFAAEGARVGLVARSKAELDLTHLEIEHQGGVSIRLRADVREPDQLRTAADRMRAHFGAPIDVLVCAAGIQGPVGPFLSNPRDTWMETVAVNLFGVVNTCATVLPDMVSRRRGKVVVLSGGGGANPRPNLSAYAASKAGLVRYVETLAEEMLEHNVQVNCMSPGGVYTHMTDEILRAGDKAGWKELEDARQVQLTGGVAAAKQVSLALFLASERSNHITGKMLHVKDDWRKLENATIPPDLYTLRRATKV